MVLHHVSPTDYQRRERRAEQAQSFDEKPLEATRSTRSSLQEATKCESFQLVVVCCCVLQIKPPFLCILMYSYVFLCILMYSYVFLCILMYSYVFLCILTNLSCFFLGHDQTQ